MIILGEWFENIDGRVLPVVWGKVQTAGGDYFRTMFHVDTGVDCTVFTPGTVEVLGFQPMPGIFSIAGVTGTTSGGTIETTIALDRENGTEISLTGHYTAIIGPTHLDIDILGRDLLYHFGLIVDRPGSFVALIAPNHRYRIEEIH
jgi:hypothetical protein